MVDLSKSPMIGISIKVSKRQIRKRVPKNAQSLWQIRLATDAWICRLDLSAAPLITNCHDAEHVLQIIIVHAFLN